jgi:hypothetical protein
VIDRYSTRLSSAASEKIGLRVAVAAGIVLLGATLMGERRR